MLLPDEVRETSFDRCLPCGISFQLVFLRPDNDDEDEFCEKFFDSFIKISLGVMTLSK